MAVLFPVFFLIWLAVILFSNYFLHDWQRMVIEQSDKRAKLITESLSSIKNIKFECWEDVVQQRLVKYRARESSYLFKYFLLMSNLNGFNDLFTPIFMLVFLLIYTRVHGDIAIDKAYLLISVTNMISQPMRAMLGLIESLSSVKIALERLNYMLEIPTFRVDIVDESLRTGEIVVDRVTAGWTSRLMADYFKSTSDPDSICIRDVSYQFMPGKMYAVVGKIGSGKSAFLAAVLGQLSFKQGSVKMHGSVGLVAQHPFLINATFQENILFGLPMNRHRYIEVLVKCRLTDDIKVLSGGDQTEIGERGVNLSGGQKQRISLARALYADKDIYLVDDTLSALDSQVSQAIFKDVIIGEFKQKRKTVILVTHNLSILDQMDSVLIINNGSFVLTGRFEDIRYKQAYVEYSSNVKFGDIDGSNRTNGKDKPAGDIVNIDLKAEHRMLDNYIESKSKSDTNRKDGMLIKKEEKSSGRVKAAIYWTYIKQFNPVLFFVGFLLFFVYIALRNLSDYWIGLWSQHTWQLSTSDYRNVYILLVCSMILTVFIRSPMTAYGMSLIGIRFNRSMMSTVFRRPIAFFELTPLGVVINRCTREMLDIDLVFNFFLQHFMINAAQFVSMVVVISVTMPFMVPVFFVLDLHVCQIRRHHYFAGI